MVLEIHAKVSDGGFPERLLKKSSAVAPRFLKDTTSMLKIIQSDVQLFIPRGQHCSGHGKGGTTKSAIRHRATSRGGEVYADEGIAPWFKYFEDGRGPVFAKGRGQTHQGKYIAKQGKQRGVLHFCIKGKDIFARSVGPAQGTHSLQKGARQAEPKVQRKANELGKWMEKL
jgi:hypothetical protein